MGCWTLHKALDADESVKNLFSLLFDSLTPARLALRANLRLLYLKDPAFSIVVNSAELSFDAQKNRPRSCDAQAVGFLGNLLLSFFEGGLGGCEACHGDAER